MQVDAKYTALKAERDKKHDEHRVYVVEVQQEWARNREVRSQRDGLLTEADASHNATSKQIVFQQPSQIPKPNRGDRTVSVVKVGPNNGGLRSEIKSIEYSCAVLVGERRVPKQQAGDMSEHAIRLEDEICVLSARLFRYLSEPKGYHLDMNGTSLQFSGAMGDNAANGRKFEVASGQCDREKQVSRERAAKVQSMEVETNMCENKFV